MTSILLAVTCPLPALSSYPSSSTASLRLSSCLPSTSATLPSSSFLPSVATVSQSSTLSKATITPPRSLPSGSTAVSFSLSLSLRPVFHRLRAVLMLSSTTVSPSSSLSLSNQASSPTRVHICIAVATLHHPRASIPMLSSWMLYVHVLTTFFFLIHLNVFLLIMPLGVNEFLKIWFKIAVHNFNKTGFI